MTRWKITVEYDGAGFCGWQRQAHDVSVQGTLEQAILKFSGEEVTMHVAGRTDAGVHAMAQVAHFDLAKPATPETIRDALNAYVRPHRVAVLAAEVVPETFHARFNATSRSYRYVVFNRRAPSPLLEGRAWHVVKPLSLEPMYKASQILLGKHDFSTFRAQNCQSSSPIRTMDWFDVRADGDSIFFETRARSFLYHQVRNMVGTLTMVGTGQWSLDDFKVAFEACDRTKGGPTAPSHGLFFLAVTYPQN